ncbi:hypothetical protein BKA56DRAFT_620508 [Ilyonectria sp. MPI-CAGE-AT-0026]|nr:hypothetical protein BKA56DRAFT_620508 [Ilyonectria sp. MPI-CAGE-AT-0026]
MQDCHEGRPPDLEAEGQDGLEESVDGGLLAHTIPALVGRNQGYQSSLVSSRSISVSSLAPCRRVTSGMPRTTGLRCRTAAIIMACTWVLLDLIQQNKKPFYDVWDAKFIMQKIEDNLGARTVDIPGVIKGSNKLIADHRRFASELHLKRSGWRNVLVRFARGNVNVPNYGWFGMEYVLRELCFEAVTYASLQGNPAILVSRPVYFRMPAQHPGHKVNAPTNTDGPRLMVFEKVEVPN